MHTHVFMHTHAYTCLCIHMHAIMSQDVIPYLLWYNVILRSSQTYRKYSFLSFRSLLFLVNNTGEVIE